MDKSIPFPQADDVAKIKRIITVSDESFITDVERMRVLLGDITGRQVQYYVSAAIYLGILNADKSFSEYGKSLRNANECEQDISLCRKIVSKEVFGEVYFTELVLGIVLDRDDIISIMKKNLSFNSEEMYRRRAQTVLKWIEWVLSKDSLHQSLR